MELHPVPPALPPRFRARKTGSRARSIGALVLREMQASYGRSPGGYIWAILEPLGMIVLLAFGFSLLLRSPSLGDSFLMFYATGFLPFNLYNQIHKKTSGALPYSRNLLVYPTVTWIDAVVARIILNFLTGCLVATLMLTTIRILVDDHAQLRFGEILLGYAVVLQLGAGIGMINAVIDAFFPIWKTIFNILNRPLFLASGVLYIYEDLPQGAQDILWFNPLLHVTALVRAGFYPTYDPQFDSPTYILAVSICLLFFGLMLLRRFNGNVLRR